MLNNITNYAQWKSKNLLNLQKKSDLGWEDLNDAKMSINMSVVDTEGDDILYTNNPHRLFRAIEDLMETERFVKYDSLFKSLVHINVFIDGSTTIQSLKLEDGRFFEIPFVQNPFVVQNIDDDQDGDQEDSTQVVEHRGVVFTNFDLLTSPEKAKLLRDRRSLKERIKYPPYAFNNSGFIRTENDSMIFVIDFRKFERKNIDSWIGNRCSHM